MVAFTSGTVLTAAALNTAFNALTVNTQTGTTYTLVLTDQGGLVTLSNASAVTVTIPTNASVAYATGTVINLLNLGAGSVTVSAAGGVTLNGTATTLAQNAQVTLIKLGTNTWNAVAGGGLPKATVSSTTGSPTTGANGSKTWYRWTGAGTVVIGTSGVIEVLICGGGAGGGSSYDVNTQAGGGGGGGGVFYNTQLYLPAATYSIAVGGGGAGGSGSGQGGKGSASNIGTFVATGGGNGASSSVQNIPGGLGASGGGGFANGAGGAAEVNTFSGYNGGGSTTTAGGGGGGATALGASGSGATGGNGGNGLTYNITGTSGIVGGGGGGAGRDARGLGGNTSANGGNGSLNGGSGSVGTVNTGTGGGGGWSTNVTGSGFAGGSGVVFLLVG